MRGINTLIYFLFYNYRYRWPSYFSPKAFSHVSLLIQGKQGWYSFNPTDAMGEIREYAWKDSDRVLKTLTKVPTLSHIVGLVLTSIKKPPKLYFPIMLPTACHNLVKYVSGVDLGWAFNPYFLYRQLLKYDQKRNYEIVRKWSLIDGWK